MFLTTSTDGLKWTELKAPNGKSFLEPQVGGKLMRDPCLRRGPDGVFHLVWTTSWGRPPVFGYASSTDLIHWSEERAIPVMENDPTAVNVWAPELFYDDGETAVAGFLGDDDSRKIPGDGQFRRPEPADSLQPSDLLRHDEGFHEFFADEAAV